MSQGDLPRILIIKAGSTHPHVSATEGDYQDWFIYALGGGPERFHVVSPDQGEELPPRRGYGGVLITGSPASVRDETPWMKLVSSYSLKAAEEDIPVLGVCFGHQLLGEALGGRVEPNPGGRELGTVEVHLTEEGRRDPLFAGVPETFLVHTTHGDELAVPPTRAGATLLATNSHSIWQSFSAGPRIRAVQFHPEFSVQVMERLLEAVGASAVLAACEAGPRILRNWDEAFVRGG